MDLTEYKKTDKLREIPEKNLDAILETKFKYFLANLLAITNEKEESLNNAIKAVKHHFVGLTLEDVKKAFQMYANSELDLVPISNHVDYILVGKIFNQFKKFRNITKDKKVVIEQHFTDEEKENIIYNGIVNCFDSYFQYRIIDDGYYWVAKYLGQKGLIKFSKEDRESMLKQAEKNIKKKALNESYHDYKKIISQIARKNNNMLGVEFSYIGLAKYFDSLISEGKHIKDLI